MQIKEVLFKISPAARFAVAFDDKTQKKITFGPLYKQQELSYGLIVPFRNTGTNDIVPLG